METIRNQPKILKLSADDFGYSAQANKNILELAKLGKIHRVAVLIEGFVTKEELIKLQQLGIKLDIHLTFPEGLRKRHGIVHRLFLFFKNHLLKKDDLIQIQKKWEEQIQKFIKIIGQKPDGLNSHEYIHFYPPYFRFILDLAKKFDIPYVRFGQRKVWGDFNATFFILSQLHRWNKKVFQSSNKTSSDYITSLDWAKNPEKFIKKLPAGEIEIVCHPEKNKEFELIKKYF